MLILESASKIISGISRGRQRPSHHLKACLRGFQRVYRAHILCEELKWENITTSKLAPRLYEHFFNLRPLEATPAASDLQDPHIWYSNDFPWPQDVKFDLGLGWPLATSSDLGIAKVFYGLKNGLIGIFPDQKSPQFFFSIFLHFYLWKSKQTAEIYFKPYFEGVPEGLLGSYFAWRAKKKLWPVQDHFRGDKTVFKFWGHSRSPEVIRGRGQIWHPEVRRSHLSIIYWGLGGPRSLERPRI